MKPTQSDISSQAPAWNLQPEQWRTWSPRPELSPRFGVDEKGGRHGGPALRIEADGHREAYGEWRRQIDGIRCSNDSAATYRLVAHYRAEDVAHPREQIVARVEWLTTEHRVENQPVYALPVEHDGSWARCEVLVRVPSDAHAAVIRLGLRWSERGTVWWDAVTFEPHPAPPQRSVTLATVTHRPWNVPSSAAAVEQFVQILDQHTPGNLDLVCLPEGITLVGTGLTYAAVAEPVPGPTTQMLGQAAARHGCYLVAGLYERVGPTIYNTAVLLDRRGRLAGTYRKTHLPQPEADGGLTPGNDYPVFDTDMGRLGLMICWDVQFPEPARALASRGAEIIALPIWGGCELLARARAIENHVFLISSSYDMRSFVVDPLGQVLAEAGADSPLAFATVDLDQPRLQPWLGDMKHTTWAERRSDLQA